MNLQAPYYRCGKVIEMKNDFRVFASILSATPDDAENLASWLADREMRDAVMKMRVDDTKQDNTCLSAEVDGYDENIAVSQIRILSKQYTNDVDVIPYVAVLEKWDEDMWLIVPFSPYKVPATEGEMSTGLETYGLQVVQAWNGRTVQDSILKKSFLFGELDSKVCNDALMLFRHEFAGVDLPEDFSAQRGGPIVEETDPRRDYIEENIERFQPLSDEVIKVAETGNGESGGVLDFLFDKYLNNTDYALAAATNDICAKVPILMHKGAWNAMKEGLEVSGFSGFYPGDGNYNLIFEFNNDLPQELKWSDKLPIEVYKRESRKLVGKGHFIEGDNGKSKIVVEILDSDDSVPVASAEELVLVVGVE